MDARSPRPLLLVPAALCGVGLALAAAGSASGSGGPIDPTHVYEKWAVTKTTTLPPTHDAWQDCATARGSKGVASVTCSKAFSISNGTSGSLGASDDVISASVGFDVTKTWTTTASSTYPVPKHQQRTIQWAARYRVKQVSTTHYWCASGPKGTNCHVKGHGEGTVRQAAGISFQLVH